MDTPTGLSFWVDRVVFAIVTVALVTAMAHAAVSGSSAGPAVRWARVVGEQVLGSIEG